MALQSKLRAGGGARGETRGKERGKEKRGEKKKKKKKTRYPRDACAGGVTSQWNSRSPITRRPEVLRRARGARTAELLGAVDRSSSVLECLFVCLFCFSLSRNKACVFCRVFLHTAFSV